MRLQRRRHERRSSRLPVWIHDNHGGVCHQGQCANISDGGAYMILPGGIGFGLGDGVQLVIGILSDIHGGFDLMRTTACAQVMRMEQLGYGVGLAVKFCDVLAPVDTRCNVMSC